MTKLSYMTELFLDFETFYDRDLTLTKLNYTEYIRQTEVQLAGIFYQGQLQTLTDPENFFNTLDWPNITLVGHNLLFDAAVLHHFYNIQAGRYIDTLGMARGLYPCSKHGLGDLAKQFDCPIQKGNLNTKGQREPSLSILREYCAKDVLIAHFLYHRLKPEFDRYLGSDELDLMDHTIKLWLNPIIRLNHTKLADIVREEAQEKQRLLDEAGMTLEQMRSNTQFAKHLESMGYEPPTKWSVKQNKLVYAFAKADIQLYAEENPELEPLLSLKSQCNSNIKESRALRLANSITYEKQVPIAYNYHGAFPGRWSGSNRLNLQNLPRGGAIRHCLHAPKGHMLIVSDLSQIEVRIMAWFANEETLLGAFKNKEDPYCKMGTKIFNRPITPADKGERRIAKNLTLGCQYGMWGTTFRQYSKGSGLNITEGQAIELITKYRIAVPSIVGFWNLMRAYLPYFSTTTPLHILGGKLTIHNNRLFLPSGRAMHYEELRYQEETAQYRLKNNKKVYFGTLVENVCQGAARDVFANRLLTIHNTVCPVVMHSHDELICIAPETEAEATAAAIQKLMCQPPDWCKDLPLDAETSVAFTYGEAK